MKRKIGYLIVAILYSLPIITFASYPEAHFGIYGIKKCKTLSEYQKYIGETVIYLPHRPASFTDLEFKGKHYTPYIITKITGSDEKMTFILQENGNKDKVEMFVLNEDNHFSKGRYIYAITDKYSIPLFLINKFNDDKKNYIGKKYTHDKIKYEYECIDVVMKPKEDSLNFKSFYPTVHFVLKNLTTGKEKVCSPENIEEECFSAYLSGKYISTLIKVEKPSNDAIRYGETKTIVIEGITKYRYVDDIIDFTIFGNKYEFNFLLKNISQNTLKLIWNEAVFVDCFGISSKVMHVGIKYSERNSDQQPSIIIKNSILEDIAVPTCNVRDSEYLKNRNVDSMYPSEPALTPGEVKLMLPIQVKDIINEYTFIFRIDWVYNHPELLKI